MKRTWRNDNIKNPRGITNRAMKIKELDIDLIFSF